MSDKSEEILVSKNVVDVDCTSEENAPKIETRCDSGIVSEDSSSTVHSSTPASEVSPTYTSKTLSEEETNASEDKCVDLGITPSLSSLTSISLDNNNDKDNLRNSNCVSSEKLDSNVDDNNDKDNLRNSNCVSPEKLDSYVANVVDSNIPDTKDDISTEEPTHEIMDDNVCPNITQTAEISTTDSNYNLTPSNEMEAYNLEMNSNEISKAFATSTASLNEQNTSTIDKNLICKSPFSKSAENISCSEQMSINYNLNSSTKDLNTDKILSEFMNQKSKASATQIIPEISHRISHSHVQNSVKDKNNDSSIRQENQVADTRYTRLPKEILAQAQDIGSIVKNVHGIFSSVSGSLKNAYSHRAVQKPVKNIIKPIPNGKVMSDIFEDQIDRTNVTNMNEFEKGVPEKTNAIPENIQKDIDEKKINEDNEDSKPKIDVLRLQVESLEKLLAEQRKENALLRERVKQQVDEIQSKDQTFRELEVKLDMMSKRVEQAEREKDAAVMRYASVECAAIEARRAADKAAAAEKAAVTEMELLSNKLKSAHSEKQRICQLYDDKCHELQNSEREVAKIREDVRELEGRLKWTQSKLRMEMDAYKEAAEKAEKLTQQVSELEVAKEAAVNNATDSARAKQLEIELKESQATLILCRHEKEDFERRLQAVTSQLDACKRERDTATSSLARLTTEVEDLKVKNLRLEEEAAELAALRAQAALADTLSQQLQRESERAAQAEETAMKERARAETCLRRESAALEHAARLTAHQVAVAAASTDHHAKAQALSLDNASLRERVASLESECDRLRAQLNEEEERRNRENRVLARKVAELTEEVSEANKKLEWEKGENDVLKKKHASAIKELNRELQRTLKRCEQLEAKLPPPETTSTRTGSVSSLSSSESAQPEDRTSNMQNGHVESVPDIQTLTQGNSQSQSIREPDRQSLIERIVSLQRAAARRAERCDFLEEHNKQLTSELRAKSRLLRHLLPNMPAGALASSHQDQHKKEIARLGGGAMAAVWGGDPGGMTLELSLEMNKRLQAVLEDALLKNITLKENMDTLGEEIARLKSQTSNAKDSK